MLDLRKIENRFKIDIARNIRSYFNLGPVDLVIHAAARQEFLNGLGLRSFLEEC